MSLSDEEVSRIEEEEVYRVQVRENIAKNNTRKRYKKWLIIILILIGIVFISLSSSTPNTNITTTSNVSVKQSQNQPIPSTFKSSTIGISRNKIIEIFQNKGYIFNKEKSIEGEENYVGRKGKGEIQLLGKSENLSSVSFTASMGFDPDGSLNSSVLAQTDMLLFASTIDKSCSDWLLEKIQESSLNKEAIFNKPGIACNRLLKFLYIPSDSMTFGVHP